MSRTTSPAHRNPRLTADLAALATLALATLALATLALATLALASGCGSDDGGSDAGIFPDAFGGREAAAPRPDVGGPTCQLGLPNSCASCTDVCPGSDDEATQRTCEGSRCAVACKGEYYDADGQLQNGCEAEDDLPLHDTAETAVDLGVVTDCDSTGSSVTGKVPSDDRRHLDKPSERKTGRADFYALRIEDEYGLTCGFDPYFRLDATALSAEVKLELLVTYTCDGEDGKVFNAQDSVTGGSSVVIELDADCPGLTDDDTGTALIEVRKSGGIGHSAASYTLIYHG